MPITPRSQIMTTEDKLGKVLEIIVTMRNQQDASTIRSFILELCKRYLDKDQELKKYTSDAVAAMNEFESRYLERILKEFGSETGF